jgi:hypothetical protein
MKRGDAMNLLAIPATGCYDCYACYTCSSCPPAGLYTLLITRRLPVTGTPPFLGPETGPNTQLSDMSETRFRYKVRLVDLKQQHNRCAKDRTNAFITIASAFKP